MGDVHPELVPLERAGLGDLRNAIPDGLIPYFPYTQEFGVGLLPIASQDMFQNLADMGWPFVWAASFFFQDDVSFKS